MSYCYSNGFKYGKFEVDGIKFGLKNRSVLGYSCGDLILKDNKCGISLFNIVSVRDQYW